MDGFQQVYERYHADVRRFALFLAGDPGRADELTVDTFARAWQARDRLDHTTVRSYLLTITKNLHRDQHRAAQRFTALEDRHVHPAPGVDVQVQHASSLRAVRTRLKRVAQGDRRALLLFVVRDMSYAEVAAALGISIGAVKSRIGRARAALVAPPRTAPRESTS